MTSLDAVFIVIFIIFFARGVWTGLVSQLAFLGALVLGFIAAGNFYEKLAPFVQKIITSPQIAFFATFTVLFLIVYFAVIAAGRGLKKVAKVSLLGWFDRFMGGMLGLGKAVLLSTLVFMVLSGVLSRSNAFLRKAYMYPFFVKSSRGVLQFVKDKDLRARFQPKDPAISSLFALQSQIAGQTEKRMLASRKEQIQELREQLAREARERRAKNFNQLFN
jgi:membrane protein required for colicin V production